MQDLEFFGTKKEYKMARCQEGSGPGIWDQ